MTCIACRRASRAAVCLSCRRTLRRTPERIVAGGVLVRSAFEHTGAARALIHRLKYDAVAGVAARLAVAMEPLLPPDATALVPVPRAHARHLGHGVDAGAALATALGRRTGITVVRALAPVWWARRRAGPVGRSRGTQRFRAVTAVPSGAVLVDDVVTTGTTLAAASRVAGARRAVTATAGHSTLTRSSDTP